MSGAFAAAALELRSFGLAPIPCAGDDGKIPGIRTKAWKTTPGTAALQKMVLRFGSQNVGILTGPSRVSVVDVDGDGLVDEMLHRFGATPLIVQTPSGHYHLYYRGSGERCANLRLSEQLPVDIKAVGGFVVVPPSHRPTGDYVGKSYTFESGGWSDLHRLPPISPGSLPSRQATPKPGARLGTIPDGTRHDDLVRRALRDVRGCDCFDHLLDSVRGDNNSCTPLLPDAEVVRIATWAWQCQIEGRTSQPGGNGTCTIWVPRLRRFSRAPAARTLRC